MPTSTQHGSAAPGPAVRGPARYARVAPVGRGARGGQSGRRARPKRPSVGAVLRRGRWLFVAVTLVVWTATVAHTLRLPVGYAASATILIRDRDTDEQGMLQGLGETHERMANELLILRNSYALATRAARRLLLMGHVPETGVPLSILRGPLGPDSVATVAHRLQGQYVASSSASDRADAVVVTGLGGRGDEAALIANVYAEEFVGLTREHSQEGEGRQRALLDRQIRDQNQTIARVNAEITAYMQREGAVALDVRTDQVVGRLAQLDADRSEVEVETARQQATAAELRRTLDEAAPDLAARFATSDAELARLEGQRDGLGLRLDALERRNPGLSTSEPPEVASLRAQAERLDGQIAALSGRITTQDLATMGGGPGSRGWAERRRSDLRRRLLETDVVLEGLEARRQANARRTGQLAQELDDLPTQALGLGSLVRQRMAAEYRRKTNEDRLVESATQHGRESDRAEILRPAAVPVAPYTRDRWRDLLVGLVVGLGLGLVATGVRQVLDDRYYTAEDLREAGYAAFPPIMRLPAEVRGGAGDPALVALHAPDGPGAEDYRALWTSLQFSRPDVVVETLLVTSARPGDGKSTTALNLAVTMARSGRKTLLVDADLRLPTVHRRLSVARVPGLTDVLGGEPLERAALPTGVENLSVLAAGTTVPNPSEQLDSQALRQLVGRLREGFDLVVFDAPPVMAATDPALLASFADATLVVVAAGKTRARELAHACEVLEEVGASIVGVVLNGVDPTAASDLYNAPQASPRRFSRASRPASVS